MNTLQARLSPSPTLVNEILALEPVAPWEPPHESCQTQRDVSLSVDLPGVDRSNLRVAFREGRLHVWGHRNPSHCPKVLDHASTRLCGEFALDVPIPDWVDLGRATQEFADGILTVIVPRRRESLKRGHA